MLAQQLPRIQGASVRPIVGVELQSQRMVESHIRRVPFSLADYHLLYGTQAIELQRCRLAGVVFEIRVLREENFEGAHGTWAECTLRRIRTYYIGISAQQRV